MASAARWKKLAPIPDERTSPLAAGSRRFPVSLATSHQPTPVPFSHDDLFWRIVLQLEICQEMGAPAATTRFLQQ